MRSMKYFRSVNYDGLFSLDFGGEEAAAIEIIDEIYILADHRIDQKYKGRDIFIENIEFLQNFVIEYVCDTFVCPEEFNMRVISTFADKVVEMAVVWIYGEYEPGHTNWDVMIRAEGV